MDKDPSFRAPSYKVIGQAILVDAEAQGFNADTESFDVTFEEIYQDPQVGPSLITYAVGLIRGQVVLEWSMDEQGGSM